MYLRFVIRRQHSQSRAPTGVFVVAAELQDSCELEAYQREQLSELLAWFNEHIRVPSRLSEPTQNRVLSWFKPDAQEAVERMWELASILRDAGVPVELLKSSDPGVILEEDEHQILAQPYRVNRKIPR